MVDKTLSDEIIPPTCHKNYENLKLEDVKKHLQEFKEELKEDINDFWTNCIGEGQCPECWENREGTKEDYMITKECMFLKIFKKIDTQMQKHFGKDLI
jgi:hypothetical protein